jgi:hypothetical protein
MAEKIKVKSGDSMSAIADKAGVSLAAIKAANPQVSNPSLIKPGQTLNVPAPKAAFTAAATKLSAADQAMINKLNAQIAKTQTTITGLEKSQADAAATKAASAAADAADVAENEKIVKEARAAAAAGSKTTVDPNDPVVGIYTDPKTGDIFQVTKSGKRLLLQAGTMAADAATAAAKDQYDAEQAALAKAAADTAEKRDAFALVQDTMRSYGFTDAELAELSGYIESSIIDPNIGPNAAILGMRNLTSYKQRFAGNEALVKAGKNALSEYDYLQQENAYDTYFKEYGVGNLSTREQKATLIGNSVSALEAKNRIGLAIDRVKNADVNVVKQLKTYYPTLDDKDLVSYFLNPVQAFPELKRKVTASEIGAAALGQGFTDTSRSLTYADYGIDRAGALEGYSNVANVLPTASKLGDIYGETGIKYTQQTGEEEFLQSSEAAKRKRNVLASKERASFEGSAGNAPGAYSTSYLKKSSAAGQI